MKAYILSIAIVLVLSFFADYLKNKKKDKASILIVILSCIVASFIAGIRDENVGTDIHNYVTALFDESGNNIFSFISLYIKYRIEIGFTALVSLFSIFRNLNVVLFGIELACILPVAIYAIKQRSKVPIACVMFVYMISMYSYSFSMMRQSIAISLGLLVLHYSRTENYKKSILFIILAFLFHRTAIVLLVLPILCYVLKKKNNDKYFYLFMIVIVSFMLFAFSTEVIKILPTKYSNRLLEDIETSVNLLSVLKKSIWIIPVAIGIKSATDQEEKNQLVIAFVLVFLDVLTYLMGMKTPIVSRLSLYYSDLAAFVYFPIIIKTTKPKWVMTLAVSSVMVFAWYHMTVNDTSARIYPYKTNVIPQLNSEER